MSLSHTVVSVDNGALFYGERDMGHTHTPEFLPIGAGHDSNVVMDAHRPDDLNPPEQCSVTADLPQFVEGQRFRLSWKRLLNEVDQARAQGLEIKPALIGPMSYLWLGHANDDSFDKLDLLERLLPEYGEIFGRLAARGVEWIQIDEPILSVVLPQAWKAGFERAYHILQYSPLKKLVATGDGDVRDNLGLAASLPVAGLHVNLVQEPEQLPSVLDRLPTYKILSLGLEDPKRWHCESSAAPDTFGLAQERFGDNLWLSGSGNLSSSAQAI
jgi:5-methyltetrahydropteroyltriglutamate--homocysteine methyltransferase